MNYPGDDKVFPVLLPLVKRFESFSSEPYRDIKGIPTIGYGATHYLNGRPVQLTDQPISIEQACEILQEDMASRSVHFSAIITRQATINQAAAMLSLAYNIGMEHFKTSTVLHAFNDNDISCASEAFLMWDKATIDGKLVFIDGLHNRRVAERALFLKADA